MPVLVYRSPKNRPELNDDDSLPDEVWSEHHHVLANLSDHFQPSVPLASPALILLKFGPSIAPPGRPGTFEIPQGNDSLCLC